MKILGIGESVIDNVCVAHQADGQNIMETQHIGGPVPSALVLLSRLGLDCTLITSLGRDKEAIVIKNVLKKEKIHLILTLQEKTKIHTIIVNAASGHREKQRGGIMHSPIKNISRHFLQQFDLIIMDRHEKQAFSEVITKKKASTRLIVDTSTEISDFTLEMMQHSECPILPIEALAKVDKKKNLVESLRILQRLCRKPIVVTAGHLGSILFDGNKLEIIPSLSVKSIDTTGAGDIFRGAFAFGLLQNWSVRECMEFANLVAGLQCTKIGNITAIPTKQEIAVCKNLVIRKKSVKTEMIRDYFSQLSQTL